MSPRAAATRYDASARLFLDAAASLIDAALSRDDDVPPRLRSIKFPAALEWIRVEDVIRLADGAAGGSKKAFRQRWATRDEFLIDAAVYTLRFADRPVDEYKPLTDRLGLLDIDDFGSSAATMAEDLMTFAEGSPRSYLMIHIGGALHRHDRLRNAFRATWAAEREPFIAGYRALLDRLGLALRPGWSLERFDRALQAMIDGFLLQGRTAVGEEDAWGRTYLFGETVVAFTLGVLDGDRSGRTARQVLTSVALGSAG